MTPKEASATVAKIASAAAHSRSMIKESFSGMGFELDSVTKSVIQDLNPLLFPEDESENGYGIPQILSKMQTKGENIEAIEMFNLMYFIKKEPALHMMCLLRGLLTEEQIDSPMWWMKSWHKDLICECGEAIIIEQADDHGDESMLIRAYCPDCDKDYDPRLYLSQEEIKHYRALGIKVEWSEQ